ncbi:MAG: hypothetical protein SFV23_04430 [Planctomycetaceae bacterium]|nr:hypothetical protein [Planctomycetaceae bacterium]
MATINERFRNTLQNLPVHESARAILLLTPPPIERQRGRPNAQERFEALELSERQVKDAIHDVDSILERHGGRRVSPMLGGLGGIVVEATAPAIFALAAMSGVSAVLEDQPVSHVASSD